MYSTHCSHPVRYNPQQIETCVMECSRRYSRDGSLQRIFAASLRGGRYSWIDDLHCSFHYLLAGTILVEMIDDLQV